MVQKAENLKPSLEFVFEPFQSGFVESKARFPAFVAGWGTGKTLCGIAKGLALSVEYPHNLGLVGRKKFTDLRDSTMRDFKRYTSLEVPQTTKEVTIPGTDSTIMFRHAEELSGLQNVNLGWFLIEQAEEFDSAEQFDMLRGRLRREGCLRQGMVIANACGHNWVWRRWVKEKQADYDLYQATSFENEQNLPADFIEDLKRLERDSLGKYKRFVLNSHEDYEREGSYWADGMNRLRATKPPQIGLVQHQPAYVVHTAWDVGYTTCLWVFQIIGTTRYFLRYYEAQGEGIGHFTDLLHKWEKELGYRYGKHFGPWDVNSPAQKATEGKTVREVAAEHGINFVSLPMDRDVNNSIATVNQHLPLCWFDKEGCDIGLDALEWFHVKKNERMSLEGKPYFIDMPEKDWSEHCARAFIIADQGIPFVEHGRSTITKDQIHRLQYKYGLTG